MSFLGMLVMVFTAAVIGAAIKLTEIAFPVLFILKLTGNLEGWSWNDLFFVFTLSAVVAVIGALKKQKQNPEKF